MSLDWHGQDENFVKIDIPDRWPWEKRTRDSGASLAERYDTRYTTNARKDRTASWAYASAAVGVGAVLQGFNGNIAWMILGVVCFALAAVLGWKAS